MLILLSPAKSLDMTPVNGRGTQPRLLNETEKLAKSLARKSRADLMELMSISEKLAKENYQRYRDFSLPFTEENAKPALLAFTGDVYLDLEAKQFSAAEMEFANRQIRILSGLYGLLRPLDLMQAYRLEMGTRLATRRGKNLYDFWGERITKLLAEDLKAEGSGLLLNLASQEYFNSLQPENLEARILNIHFKELRNGKYKFITYNAKRARGKMARLITVEGITDAEPLKELVVNDYVYDASLSTENEWTFVK